MGMASVDDVAQIAASTRAGLLRLIARYDDEATPYRAVRRLGFADSYRYDAFAHLAGDEAQRNGERI